MGGYLGRDAILKADDRLTEEVMIPEWGGSVLVRGMSGRERDEYESSMVVMRAGRAVPDPVNLRAKLVARCVIGEDGEPLFTAGDVAGLGEKSSAALDRVFAVASRLSGLSPQDLEDLGKPSGNGLSAGSASS